MNKTGKLYVVGIGPGDFEQMTIQAVKALENSDVIFGYTVYIDLIKEHFPQKEFFSTPMKGEVERCKGALEQARTGLHVSMVCSGDAGVYGMSGLILELQNPDMKVEVQVIPGVTAACSGGALLGAPLIHDFAVISLSDLLTPMELIEKRISCAAQADFAICIYNPSSKKRGDYLKRACGIILEFRSPETICGIVKHIGREGEEVQVVTLKQLESISVDMFTTVFIGNSQTKNIDGKMVTPRGYHYE